MTLPQEDPGGIDEVDTSDQVGKPLFSLLHLPSGLTWGSVSMRLLKQASPLAGSSILFFFTQAVTLAFVGKRLGDDGQAAYAIGLSIFNVTGMSLCIGFMSCVDTLCSQSYGRDPSGKELPVILLRALALSLAMCIPIIALFYLVIAPLMVVLYGDVIGGGAAAYLKATPVYMIVNTAGFALQRTFQAQQAAHLGLIPYIVSGAMSPLVAHWVIHDRVETAPIATSIVATIALAGLVLLALFHPHSKLRQLPIEIKNEPSKLFEWRGLRECIDTGMPALAACCAEWWAFELLLLAAARNGAVITDSFTVAFNVMTLLFAMPNGLAVTCCVAIGNHLGANEPREAEAWTRICTVCAIVNVVVDCVLLLLFSTTVFGLYTDDLVVLATLRRCLSALMLFHIFDVGQTAMQACFRGVGKQETAAKISLATIWLVGLPCGVAASLVAPFVGPILGFAIGLCLLACVMWRAVKAWDWSALAAAASKQATAERATGTEAEASSAEPEHGETIALVV